MTVLGLSDMPLQLFSIQEQLQEADGDLQKRITIVNETLTPLISHILELHSNSDLHKSCDDVNKIIKSKDIVARRLIFKIDAIVCNIEKIIKSSSSCLESNPLARTSSSTQSVGLTDHTTCAVGEEDSSSTLTTINQASRGTPFGSFPSSSSSIYTANPLVQTSPPNQSVSLAERSTCEITEDDIIEERTSEVLESSPFGSFSPSSSIAAGKEGKESSNSRRLLRCTIITKKVGEENVTVEVGEEGNPSSLNKATVDRIKWTLDILSRIPPEYRYLKSSTHSIGEE